MTLRDEFDRLDKALDNLGEQLSTLIRRQMWETGLAIVAVCLLFAALGVIAWGLS